jgi:hypothetical protein
MMQGTRSLILARENGELVEFPFYKLKKIVRREEKFFPRMDILEECQKYYDILAAYVEECAEKFEAAVKP